MLGASAQTLSTDGAGTRTISCVRRSEMNTSADEPGSSDVSFGSFDSNAT
jgi:hypothetical protein